MTKNALLLFFTFFFTIPISAQNDLEFYFGPRMYTSIHLSANPVLLSDGTFLFQQNNQPQTVNALSGTLGFQIPLAYGFSFRVGASYQEVVDRPYFIFPFDNSIFPYHEKGRSNSWSIINIEPVLRFSYRGFGIEGGVYFAQNVAHNKGTYSWHYMSDAQNDFFNATARNLKSSFLFYHIGASYRYKQFDFLIQVQWAEDVYNNMEFNNEPVLRKASVQQYSIGINYHIPMLKLK